MMASPEDTTRRHPAIHLLGAHADGLSDYITGMERDGQRQVLGSDTIPTKVSGPSGPVSDTDLEGLGFTLGGQVPGDPLFRYATLPTGWRRQGSDHDMWSYIVDDADRQRFSVFYKAAFYDRDAHMRLASVESYMRDVVAGDGPPTTDPEWCTREAAVAALGRIRETVAGMLPFDDEDRGQYSTQIARIDALLRNLGGEV